MLELSNLELHNITDSLKTKQSYKVPTLKECFKIEDCAFISEVKEHQVFYSCTCTIDDSALICKACVKKCHQGPDHYTKLFDELDGNVICYCGRNRHVLDQKISNEAELKICYFSALFEKCVPKFYLKNIDSEGYHCLFCENFNEILENLKKDPNITKPTLTNLYVDVDPSCDMKLKCSYDQNHGKIISAINFLKLLNKTHTFPKNLKEEKDNNYLRKYLLEINYNIIDVLKINDIFYKDIIESDIKKDFFGQDPSHHSHATFIFTNSFFKYYEMAFFNCRLMENANYIVMKNFFEHLTTDELKIIMRTSINLINLDLDKPEVFPLLIENINNGFFIFFNCFYSFIYSYFTKYKVFFKTTTIINLTIVQRNYFLIECLDKINTNQNGIEQEEEVRVLKYWLEILPDLLLEYIERIISFKIYEFKVFNTNLSPHFYMIFKVFKFLIKYNLIPTTKIIRFLKFFEFVLQNNYKIFNKEDSDFIKIPKIDDLLKIVLFINLYNNDEIFINTFKNNGNCTSLKKFSFMADENNYLVEVSSKIFLLLLRTINFLNTESTKRKMIFEHTLIPKRQRKFYENNKSNYFIKILFELLIECQRKSNSYIYTFIYKNKYKLT